jgi:hypothetical protein
LTDADKAKSRLWIAVGLCLHLTAMGLLAAYLLGAFDSTPSEPDSTPNTTPKKTDTVRPKKEKKKNPE